MFSYVALQILLDLEKIDLETNTLPPVAILEMSTLVKDLDHLEYFGMWTCRGQRLVMSTHCAINQLLRMQPYNI